MRQKEKQSIRHEEKMMMELDNELTILRERYDEQQV